MGIMRRVSPQFEGSLPHLKSVAASLTSEVERLRRERVDMELELAAARAELSRREALEVRWQEERQDLEASATGWQQEREALEARWRQERVEFETKWRHENQLLREQLDQRNRQLYGKTSERRPAAPPAAPAGDVDPAAAAPPKKKNKKGHGRTAQPELPAADVIHSLPEDQRACTSCGGELAAIGTAEESELIALEERKVVLERHLRTKYTCPCCRGIVVAPGPVKLMPGGRYALSFAVEVAFLKYFVHVPLERQVHMFKHQGLRVTNATLCDQIDALATALVNTYQAILKLVQAEPVLRADETPWAVLANGHTVNERFYAWVAVGSTYVAYCLLDNRSKDGAVSLLGGFTGTLMVDGLTSYPAAAKGAEKGDAPKFKVANCWVHARRKFVDSEAHYPAESRIMLDMIRELYALEREGAGADLGAIRNEKSRPVVDRIFTWAREQQGRPDILSGSTLANALGYLLNHEAGLRVFLEDPAVPADNNESEQAMRTPVLGRKNYYGSRSRNATDWAAILFTLVECAKRVGVSPRAYVEAAAEHALRRAGAVLLPHEFKQQLDAARDPTLKTA